jgi:glyoxylase I family protein
MVNRLFGARHLVYAIGGGMLFGLHVFPDGDGSVGFNPRRPGLDHVAFNCADRAELRHWQDRLNELSIKHGVIVDTHYGSGLSFRDPDDIDFAPPAA